MKMTSKTVESSSETFDKPALK